MVSVILFWKKLDVFLALQLDRQSVPAHAHVVFCQSSRRYERPLENQFYISYCHTSLFWWFEFNAYFERVILLLLLQILKSD